MSHDDDTTHAGIHTVPISVSNNNFVPDSTQDPDRHDSSPPRIISHSSDEDSQGYMTPTESDWSDFNWWNYGSKKLKRNSGSVIRKYYNCPGSESKHSSCPAKMQVDYIGDAVVNRQIIEEHNHPAPIKKKLHPDTRAKVHAMIDHGVKPSRIHKTLVLEADKAGEEISAKNVTSRNNIRQMTYRHRHRALPSSDALVNIKSMHGAFVLTIILHPKVLIVCMDPDAVDLLVKFGRTAFLDGTFDIIEGELYLTSLLIKPPDSKYALGVAWLISEERTTETYNTFFSLLLKRTQNQWRPEFILSDFEQALRNACMTSFPRANVLGDSFHFMYDNKKYLRRFNGQELSTTATPLLQELWKAETKALFDATYTRFQRAMEAEHRADYLDYFHRIWIKLYPPLIWSTYGRVNYPIPSGDQLMEGFNSRLQNSVVTKRREDIDFVVKMLHEEWKYGYLIFITPILDSERSKEVRRSRRTTLKTLTTTEHPEMVVSEDLEEPTNNNNNQVLVSVDSYRCNCGRLVNANCSNSMCKACCLKSALTCRITDHMKTKTTQAQLIETLDSALAGKRLVWIKYHTKGRKTALIRPVKLQAWANKPLSFNARCMIDDANKKFLVSRIADLRENHWTESQSDNVIM
jgi:hypothetical protein